MDETIINLKDRAFESYKKKDFQSASELFEQCVRLLDEKKDLLAAAEMRNNLSVVLLELKQPQKALDALQGTAPAFAEANDKKRQAMSLGNIATALQALGKLDEALTTFEQSAELFKEINEKEMRAITLKKISDLQLKTGRQFQALASLDAAYDQKEKRNLKERILKGFLGDVIKKITHKT